MCVQFVRIFAYSEKNLAWLKPIFPWLQLTASISIVNYLLGFCFNYIATNENLISSTQKMDENGFAGLKMFYLSQKKAFYSNIHVITDQKRVKQNLSFLIA